MVMMENSKTKDINKESVEQRFPPLEVAKARIQLALLRYKVAVGKAESASKKEKEKVRL